MILRESRRRRCHHQRDEETNEVTTACDHDSDYIDKRIFASGVSILDHQMGGRYVYLLRAPGAALGSK